MAPSISPSHLPQSEAEKLIVAQALACYRDLKKVGQAAPYGQFLNHADNAARIEGQKLTQTILQTLAQEEVSELQKKKETRECPKCQTKKRHLGYRSKKIETSIGTIKIRRRYDECRPCNLPEHPVDEPLGLADDYTVGFRSLAVGLGADVSFQKAAEALRFYCQLKLSRMTVRKLCYKEAPKMEKWMQKTPEIAAEFIKAPGNVEITIDATKVNTMGGWRDLKLCIFSKRLLGEGVLPAKWGKRQLPDTSVRVAFAAIEKKDRFRNRLGGWRRRLRPGLTGDISALADGAGWIWDIVRSEFGKVRECLDVYHALEHLSNTGKVLYGEGTAECKQWYEASKKELLSDGLELIVKRLDRLEKEKWKDRQRGILRRLRDYLSSHSERLCYRERLAEGRAIGSGQVEGACKSMIGRRLKQTGARWKGRCLNRMTILCALRYSNAWEQYWKAI
jgi:hypothetical protein